MCFGKHFCLVSAQAEALAFCKACLFCLKAGISNILFEGYNISVVNWCSEAPPKPPRDCSDIVRDILSFAPRLNASFSHIKRDANKVANWGSEAPPNAFFFVFRISSVFEAFNY